MFSFLNFVFKTSSFPLKYYTQRLLSVLNNLADNSLRFVRCILFIIHVFLTESAKNQYCISKIWSHVTKTYRLFPKRSDVRLFYYKNKKITEQITFSTSSHQYRWTNRRIGWPDFCLYQEIIRYSISLVLTSVML